MPEERYIEEKKAGTGTLIAGGAIIVVGSAGIYYLYSRNKLINEYVNAVDDYIREYEEFRQDGVITQEEEDILGQKQQRIFVLGKQLEAEGILDKAWKIIVGLIGIPISYYGSRTIYEFVKKYRERKPPKPPNYVCPFCNKDLKTDYRLKRHIREHHNNDIINTDAPHIWDDLINKLSDWVKDAIAFLANVPRHILDKKWSDIPERDRLRIYVAVIVVIIALAAIFIFAPELTPVVAAL